MILLLLLKGIAVGLAIAAPVGPVAVLCIRRTLLQGPSAGLASGFGAVTADVIFGAHTGLGLAAFPREIWRRTPIGRTLRERMWLVPADERPDDPEAQVQWLYEWWHRIDDWVDSQGEEAPESVSHS